MSASIPIGEKLPLVTIGMPVRNCGATLEPAIRSILLQTYPCWELCLIDDGSKDKTLEIARSFSDSRIKVLSDGRSFGTGPRLNQAIELSHGEYFALMHGDDVAYPRRLERQVAYLIAHPDVDLVGARMIVFKSRGVPIGKRNHPERHDDICARPIAGFPLSHPTYCGRGRFFRKHLYNHCGSRCEDQDLLLRSYRESRFANVPEILLGYREDSIHLMKILKSRVYFARSLAREFGKQQQPLLALRGIFEQGLKGIVDSVAVASGLHHRLLRHRARPISSSERQEWEMVWQLVNQAGSLTSLSKDLMTGQAPDHTDPSRQEGHAPQGRPIRMDAVKVLHIQKVGGIGGSENHLLTLLPRLRQAGFDPSMLVLADRNDRPDDFVIRMRAAGVPTEVLPLRSDVSLSLLLRLVRYLRARPFDIIHTHLFHADLYGCLAARLAGVGTIISTRHNPDPFRRSGLIRMLTRCARSSWDHVICISDHLRQFCESIDGVPALSLTTIRYGHLPRPIEDGRAWRRQYGWSDEIPVLGMVARMIPQKGHSVLLDALSSVIQQFPSVQVILIGDGALRATLEAQVVTLGIKDHVHFLGYREDAASWMPGFEIFVHPSRWEGFGLVFLEAMNAAVPIVATTAGAIPEIVRHGETGLLVPPDRPAELAEAICTLLRDRPRATAMGKAGRRRLEETFTVERMVEQTCAVYRRCDAREKRGWGLGVRG